MESTFQRNLLLYALISAVGFAYLILHENAGISVLVFAVIQIAGWYWLAPQKKALWYFVPIFILALNPLLSANPMWMLPNYVVITLLYSAMALTMTDRFPIKEDSLRFISKTIVNVFAPFEHFTLPLKWWSKTDADKSETAKKVLKGLALTAPFLLVIMIMLSSADDVFLKSSDSFFQYIGNGVDVQMIAKALVGCIAGLYLLGLLYFTHYPKNEDNPTAITHKDGDLTVLNILLISVLAVYTLFVFIQFRYLFAGGQLPYGLSYTEYARKGFFELLFLSGLNIVLILSTVNLTRSAQGLWAKITHYLCHYLCLVTIVLLVSSFYRMWLYSSFFGLTQLRFLVFGFLIFEAIGLLVTFFYIARPSFNIAAVYLGIGLVYYLLLNLTPMDAVIARNQVDRYLDKGKPGIEYVFSLSPDAAPQVARLLNSEKADPKLRESARVYFERIGKRHEGSHDWRSYNLSFEKASALAEKQAVSR